ncbi:RHS repeat protein [Aspergillus eucalypticola CBS 122712]|uniref:RHS repeat protein n=1 Tax=Aspergillus eucalypticola (strain CBS 122712 / IBT 29274) TaxID=1448314 RepID=A0A317V9N7_ASPEC|nr:RHS repeat protein [Aspergillus eucalypticola CBS 122712]PWY68690.1 RHS repeat protein [Aspergillus eucalypticola CBS 122712]
MIYSQGFNFNSYVEKGVDPRTGQYNCTISLYEVPAEVRNGPPLKLALQYHSLNSDDVGLGKGWSFGNLSSYDQSSKTLVLSTGENYKVQETTSSVFITDQKLKNFVFQKTSTTTYRVILKSGQVEELSTFNRGSVGVPTEIYAANGRSLKLSWVFSGTQPRLSKIEADEQSLVEVDYSLSSQTTITRAPGTTEAAIFTLKKLNDRLSELILPLNGSAAWKFIYGTTGELTELTSPTGAKETISYDLQGLKLPSGASVTSIPCVIAHTAWPFHDQPAIRTTYSYSAHNFLGYGGGRTWTNDGDNLYLTPADYTYTSTLHVEGGTTTIHTYNKFHLLTRKVQQKNYKKLTQATTYYALSNTAFDSQPAQYQLPMSQATTYEDTSTKVSRTERTEFTFDEWGNETSETLPSGITTTREYYVPAGETASDQDLCPADPHGFQRYLKLETVIPGASAYSTPTRAHRYTYLKLSTATGALATYFVAAQQRVTSENDQTLVTSDYTYLNQPQSSDHGRRQQQVTYLHNQSPTTYQWTYSHGGVAALTEVTTMTSFDGQTAQTEITSSLLSGLTLATKDSAGITTTQEYDAVGRLLRTTTAPGTSFEATKTHAYAILTDTIGWRVTVTDTKGVQTQYFTDGMDRVVRIECQDDDGSWDQYQTYTGTFRVVRERRYNALNQCIEEVDVDWLRASGTPTELRTSRSLAYDDWGQVYKVTKNSGAVQLSETDPIALTQMVGNEGEGQIQIQYNVFQTPISETLVRLDGKPESTITYAYDGLGRRRQVTDGLGQVTQYSYDSFDRVVQTTWPDGHAIITEYATQSAAPLPTAINLQGAEGFSTQSFDGLERPLSTTVGGRTTTNTYQGVIPLPAQIINPEGRSERTYEPALGYALTGRVTSDGSNAYQYDQQTGDVLQMTGSLAATSLSYYPSSLLSQETVHTTAGARDLQYVYSQAGKLQEYTDIHGMQHTIQYDVYGRRQQISVGTLKTTLSYDQADRVTRTVVQDSSKNVTLTTVIGYDEFGREVQRTVSKGTTLVSHSTQSYGVTGLVATRSRRNGSNTVTRQETFEYDSLSRLVDYQCQGTQPPVDEQGRALRRQRFTFNNYDGLTQIQTTFVDGSVNTQAYTYSTQDPTQLVRITDSDATAGDITLEYDNNGCLTRDEHGRKLVYNASRLLAAVFDSQDQLLCEYGYDATDRLVRQTIPNEPDTQFSYRGDTLISITKGDSQTSFAADGGIYWGEVQQQGTTATTQLWASDSHHSVSTWLSPADADQVYDQAYTPYGGSAVGATIGFNGQWRDPVTGWYHLGAGYRVYNPNLKIFLQPDGWSPFTSGEINPYAYCLGDPINRADPSGHLSWRSFAQMMVGLVVSVGLGVFTGGLGWFTGGVAFVANVAIGAAVSAGTGLTYDRLTGKPFSWKNVGLDAFNGAVGGALGYGLGVGFNAPTPDTVMGKIVLAIQEEVIGGVLAYPVDLFLGWAEGAIFSENSQASDPLATSASYLADWPMEKLRQQRGSMILTSAPTTQGGLRQLPGRDGTGSTSSEALSARTTSRETVTAEDVSLNALAGESYDGSQLLLQLSPDHRVCFTINAQAVHVPAWDVTASSDFYRSRP